MVGEKNTLMQLLRVPLEAGIDRAESRSDCAELIQLDWRRARASRYGAVGGRRTTEDKRRREEIS